MTICQTDPGHRGPRYALANHGKQSRVGVGVEGAGEVGSRGLLVAAGVEAVTAPALRKKGLLAQELVESRGVRVLLRGDGAGEARGGEHGDQRDRYEANSRSFSHRGTSLD